MRPLPDIKLGDLFSGLPQDLADQVVVCGEIRQPGEGGEMAVTYRVKLEVLEALVNHLDQHPDKQSDKPWEKAPDWWKPDN